MKWSRNVPGLWRSAMPAPRPLCCDFCSQHRHPALRGRHRPPRPHLRRFAAAGGRRDHAATSPEPAHPPVPPSRGGTPRVDPFPASLWSPTLTNSSSVKRSPKAASPWASPITSSGSSIPGPLATRSSPTLTCTMCESRSPTSCLIGPCGCGKTHLVKSLASYLNVPLAIGDATSSDGSRVCRR